MPVKDVQQLVHELQVHQIELEMQNDELRRTQVELEAARDRYMDLYDFSPAGHLTLDTSRHDCGGQSEGRDIAAGQPESADRTITRALYCREGCGHVPPALSGGLEDRHATNL